MKIKFVILSLLVFLAGNAARSWVDSQQRKEKQLLKQQQEKFEAGLYILDKMVAGETDANPSDEIISGQNLQNEIDRYKKRIETRELASTVSILLMLSGGSFASLWFLLQTARLTIRSSSRLKQFTSRIRRRLKRKEQESVDIELAEIEDPIAQQKKKSKKIGRRKKLSKILVKAGWQNLKPHKSYKNKIHTADSEENPENIGKSPGNFSKIAMLLSDQRYVASNGPLKEAPKQLYINADSSDKTAESTDNTETLDSNANTKAVDSLSKQNKSHKKTRDKSSKKEISQSTSENENLELPLPGQLSGTENSEPINNALSNLAQQVAAIREYASLQQNRVEKLQDGYDWNIIRTFCLRVIRCIDNIDSRINRLSRQNIETADLEEVRDELIFALESSGVEQFEPQINSDYRGQEKQAEAIKTKQATEDPELKDKVAKVIRQGYRYIIGDDKLKIVRTARVKLFA